MAQHKPKRKLIGKGAFSRAYQVSDTEVELVSVCPTKECYAMFSQDNKLAPKIEVKGFKDSKTIYRMPLYPKIKSVKQQLNAKSLFMYNELRKVMYEYFDYGLMRIGGDVRERFIREVNKSKIHHYYKKLIISLADDVCNSVDCSDFRFEISPRNITCDSKGNLILLDCFFSKKLLQSIMGF